MIRLPDPAAVVDAAGLDVERLTAERDAVGRRVRTVSYGLLAGFVLVLVAGVVAVLAGWVSLRPGPVLPVAFFVIAGAGFLVNWYLQRHTAPLERRIDAELVGPVLQAYAAEVDRLNGTTGGHLELGRADEGLLWDAEVVDTGDQRYPDDLVAGVLAGEPVRIAEYRVAERRGTGKNRRTVTIFRGTVAELRTARPVTAPLRIVPRGTTGFQGAGLFSGDGVPMENPAVRDAFAVHTERPQEAFFVLPPTVQEELVAVAARQPGGMGVRAEGDRLLVAVGHQRDLFDVVVTSREPLRDGLALIVAQLNETVWSAALLGAWAGRLERPAPLA